MYYSLALQKLLGGVFESKWSSKNPLLPLLSTPALPFGICPPVVILTIPTYGS